MKRTELKRKTPLKQGGPIERKSALSGGKPMERRGLSSTKRASTSNKRRSVSPVNDNRWRSPTYLAWVRTLSCCVCGAPANAAHHLKGIWHMSGAGLKAPDSMVMPVCDGPGGTCHRRIHNEQALRDRQPAFLRDTLSRAVRVFDGETKAELVKAWRIIEEREAA